jgi:hypothetical protein
MKSKFFYSAFAIRRNRHHKSQMRGRFSFIRKLASARASGTKRSIALAVSHDLGLIRKNLKK